MLSSLEPLFNELQPDLIIGELLIVMHHNELEFMQLSVGVRILLLGRNVLHHRQLSPGPVMLGVVHSRVLPLWLGLLSSPGCD
jgi:hypothetical protein